MTTTMRYSAGVGVFWLIYAGLLCEEDVGVCEPQPCHNGGVCERDGSGFRCLCSQSSQRGRLYGGDTCAVALSGCHDHRCENGGKCRPLLVQDQHTYRCGCPAGFSGPRCQTPTAFSFQGRGGFLRVETRVRRAPMRLAFSFRTRGAAGTLLQSRVDHLLLTVELLSGRLRLSGRRGRGSNVTLVQELQGNVSDGEWHAVEASLGAGGSWIRLLCAGGCCDGGCDGAPGLTLGVGAEAPAAFRGCLRDVVVDSQLVLARGPGPEAEATQVNVTVGCSDEDLCEGAPCGGRGRCVAQGWRGYRCVCHRPYQGADCQGEYVPARFGADSLESYSVFSLVDPPPTLGSDQQPPTLVSDQQLPTLVSDQQLPTLGSDQQPPTLVVSMFVRPELPGGLLLVLANSSSQYLRLWLEEGRVKVQLNDLESVRGGDAPADGRYRLLTVEVWDHVAVLTQAGRVQASVGVRPVRPRPGDRVFVGGLPDPRAAAGFGGYFRGCVQDLRINGGPLQVFPLPGSAPAESHRLEQSVHVTPGCGSDNDCAGAPCLDGVTLGPLDIGGIPLPFHGDEEPSLPRPQKKQFLLWEADTCSDHRCGPGATCLRGVGGYGCLCPRNMTGPYCAEKREIPWYVEIKPRAELPVAECVRRGRSYSCFHGGSCSAGERICHCAAGFTGHWCETDVDECASDPCMHGGLCLDQWAGWECVCDQNYWGLHCQTDASDFHLYLFLVLWQSFLQVLSYEVWHLGEFDDIDWANLT